MKRRSDHPPSTFHLAVRKRYLKPNEAGLSILLRLHPGKVHVLSRARTPCLLARRMFFQNFSLFTLTYEMS